MKEYIFYDTDDTGFEEYDICGEDYRRLIETCCKYSSYFSVFHSASQPEKVLPLLTQLEPYEIPKPASVPNMYTHYEYVSGTAHYYRVCPELCEVLMNSVVSLFDWIPIRGFQNPEDPAFYRKNGTPFFSSTIHEGCCILTPYWDENVESIISAGPWKKGQGDGLHEP